MPTIRLAADAKNFDKPARRDVRYIIEQHVTLSAGTGARPVSLPCCLSIIGSL